VKLGLIAAVGSFALVAGAAGAAVLLMTGKRSRSDAPPRGAGREWERVVACAV
jgi:hypothetical protein